MLKKREPLIRLQPSAATRECIAARVYIRLGGLAKEIIQKGPQQFVAGDFEVHLLGHSHATHLALQQRAEVEELAGLYGNGYTMHLARHFRSLVSHNIPTDIVHLGDHFSKYRVLIVAALEVMDRGLAKKLEAYVQDGGILVMTPRSALLDENAKEWEVPLPAHLTHVMGVTVESMAALRERKLALNLAPANGIHLPAVATSSLIEVLGLEPSAQILATFRGQSSFDNLPALTKHAYGKGTAYYLAAFLGEEEMGILHPAILKPHGIHAEFDVSEGVQFAKRKGRDADFYFFFNSSSQPVSLRLPFPVQDVFSAQPVSGWTIEPMSCRIGKKQTVTGGSR